jgi:uncharacterized membrane protein YjjP (DUF1212 family)
MYSTTQAQGNERPGFLPSLCYGFAAALLISLVGYLARNTAIAIVPIVLGLPGFLVGILSNNSLHGGKESVIATVAAGVNGAIYFGVIHIFRLLRYKGKTRKPANPNY